MADNPMIYGLIQKAMGMIGAIGKDSTATNQSGRQMYKFRGIDAVYNALNPVMAELGLFICPEILDQTREERVTSNQARLVYTILTIKYTMYAPDGSNISMTVVGEGMDSGDKSANKAMSVALKYAMFQLFMIPTEEMIDPDAEVHDDVQAKNRQTPPQNPPQKQFTPPPAAQNAKVTTGGTVPPVGQAAPPANPQTPPPPVEISPVVKYLINETAELRKARGIDAKANRELFGKQLAVLQAAGLAPKKPKEEYTMQEAESLIAAMYSRFDPQGTELKEVVGG